MWLLSCHCHVPAVYASAFSASTRVIFVESTRNTPFEIWSPEWITNTLTGDTHSWRTVNFVLADRSKVHSLVFWEERIHHIQSWYERLEFVFSCNTLHNSMEISGIIVSASTNVRCESVFYSTLQAIHARDYPLSQSLNKFRSYLGQE